MSEDVFNAYRNMWIFTFFDLPTNTKAERRIASGFRKLLLKDGFIMLQFSVYVRACPTKENTKVHIERVKKELPKKGKVSILTVTDKQFGDILNFWNVPSGEEPPEHYVQLTLF